MQAKVISPHCYCWNREKYSSWDPVESQWLVQKCRVLFSSHNWSVSYSLFLRPAPQPTYLCVSQPAAAVCPLAYEGSQPDKLLPPDPETFWQSRQHVWCHSSLAGRSLPCRRHQWFPPDGKGHVSLTGRHQAFLSKGDQNKIYLSYPPLAKLPCSPRAMAGLGFHGFWPAGLVYLIFTREQSKKDFGNFQIPCLQVCTHLVNIVRLNPAVKADVQIVEHLNNLQGSTGGSNACEPHDV